MDVTRALGVATTAIEAQRSRIEVIASNLANAQTTRTAEGGPFVRMDAVFRSVMLEDGSVGVEVADIVPDPSEGPRVFSPGHPDADGDGYLRLPNVNVMTEMVDLMSAVRAYEASVTAAESARDMAKKTLEIAR